MTTILLFILLVIIAVVVMAIVNQNKVELGSRAEDILLEQARVAELRAELEQAGIQEREELTALRLEMQILEKESAKNVLTLEKELIASGLKGKDAEDALRKELEETRLSEQVKVAAIQSQLDKAKTHEQAKVKTIQSELDKSQARIGLMETNVEKLKNKPAAEIADLKKKLSEAMVSTRDAQEKANAQASLIKAEKSEAAKELKAIQDELNRLKEVEADKRKTLNTKLGDSVDTIEDLEEEIGYLKNQAAIYASEKAAAKKAAAEKAAADKAAAKKAAIEKAAADKAAAEKAAIEKIAADKKAAIEKIAADKKAAIEKVAAIDIRPDSVKEFTNPEEFTSSAPFKHVGDGRLRPEHSGYPYSQFITKEKGGVEPGIPKGAVDECQAKCKTDPTCPGISMERYRDDAINCMHFRKQTGKATHQSCVYPPFGGECGTGSTRVSASDPHATYWRGTRTKSNTWARPESSWFGTPTPDPDDFRGYTDNGNGFCKSGQLFSSGAYALLKPGESRTKAPSFDAPLYKEYAKRGQDKCDANPKCNHVTVWRNAGYRMYDTDNCADKHDPSGSNRSWKKYGNGNVDPAAKRAAAAAAAAELAAKIANSPDSTRELANPEEFTSSAPFKPLGKWRIGRTVSGYSYSQFKTKSKVKELAVDECQAACKKDPTCPGITMQRYGDGSINCMTYRKHSGREGVVDLCVYPPFETDDYKCVHDLPGDSPGTYWRGTRTTSTASIEAAPKAKAAAEAKLEVVRLKEELKKLGLDTTGLKADLVARLKEAVLGKTDSVRESAIPETFTSSAPFKPLGDGRLDPGPSGYPYSQFITKSKVEELAVDECQAACKKDPTCPGISMQRGGDGAINCMTFKKQSGNASNELCVYPPFENTVAVSGDCKYAPFDPSKNYPVTPGYERTDNYSKFCKNLVNAKTPECALKLCATTDAKNACKGECAPVLASAPESILDYNCARDRGTGPGTYWRGTRTTSTVGIEAATKAKAAAEKAAAEKAAADKTFAKEQAAICSERDVTGKPMSTNWQVFGKCQPDPKDPKKGRKLLQKGYIDHGGKVTGVRGKCARFVKFEECSQDCEYKSGSYLSPNGWFGWVEGKNKDAGMVVSRHKVIYPAIGKSKTCCRQLGCANDCIDPPPGEYIHKDRGVVVNSDKLKYGWNDRCDGWGNACIVDKDIWNMFKGRFNKKAEMKKKYGAKFPQQGGACATPTMSPGQYAKDNETRKLYYYG